MGLAAAAGRGHRRHPLLALAVAALLRRAAGGASSSAGDADDCEQEALVNASRHAGLGLARCVEFEKPSKEQLEDCACEAYVPLQRLLLEVPASCAEDPAFELLRDAMLPLTLTLDGESWLASCDAGCAQRKLTFLAAVGDGVGYNLEECLERHAVLAGPAFEACLCSTRLPVKEALQALPEVCFLDPQLHALRHVPDPEVTVDGVSWQVTCHTERPVATTTTLAAGPSVDAERRGPAVLRTWLMAIAGAAALLLLCAGYCWAAEGRSPLEPPRGRAPDAAAGKVGGAGAAAGDAGLELRALTAPQAE